MEEEEEDRVLLHSLGVTSANAEDIELNILEQAKTKAEDCTEGSAEEEILDRIKSNATASTGHRDVYNKLRAVEIEIDAVKSSLELTKFARNQEHHVEGDDREKQENIGGEGNDYGASPNDTSLQHALATDRLRSLLKRKAQLEKEISDTSEDIKHEKLLRSIVEEDTVSKKRTKEIPGKSNHKSKKFKTVTFTEDDGFDAALNVASAGFVETERDELVRRGILTPFHKLKGYERRIQKPGSSGENDGEGVRANTDLASSSIARAVQSISEAAHTRPTTKLLESEFLPKLQPPTRPFQRLRKPLKIPVSLENDTQKNKALKRKKRRPLPAKKWRKSASCEERASKGNDSEGLSSEEDDVDADGEETPFVELEGGLKIPETIFSRLFDYQKVGVQWLWELHCQRAGGIIGDEMGLGKTVQITAFLGALHFSNMYKPSIIVCPVTLLRQWKREVQKWYPRFHVEILHDSAQNMSSGKKQSKSSESEDLSDSDIEEKLLPRKTKKWDSLVNRVLRTESGLLLTTYEQLKLLSDVLLDIEWGYAVLDEGHRIRNPNAEITLICKQLQTVHRLIMTGSPIQNKLAELWSLFDFVFPGKLGVLPVFEAEFAVPISVGGYANATPLQVSTAYRCAVVLRDIIMPYLLRRIKADVDAHLPKKTEHVLFCSLTAEQRSIYRAFLASSEVEEIFNGSRNSLYGIDVMRKICNHPDLLEREHSCNNPDYGNSDRSGKMKVIIQVLKVWKEQGHRVLLFAQTQQMLDIIENFLISVDYSYRRMDGATPVKHRMTLIDEFNNSDDVFIFILTTKVGGLGTNLTGADRVIIYDPDWNPSTDIQARERAWRIGQKKDVTVYRLITKGTIEEKVYHRQIYKHFLTNKILQNPQQKRFFKARDMKDLFTLNDDSEDGSTETSNIFSQLSENVNIVGAHENDQKKPKSPRKTARSYEGVPSDGHKNLETEKKQEEVTGQSHGEVDEETSILRSLFDAQGIHSALNHDAIVNAHDEDKNKMEEHALKVAQRAAEALRQSRMLRNRDNVAIPTWTGKSGAAGAPSSVRKKFGSTVSVQLIGNSTSSEELVNGEENGRNGFVAGAYSGKALSSTELLARMRGNQEKAARQGLEHQFDLGTSSNGGGRSVSSGTSRTSNKVSAQPEVLIRQICTFIQQRGGRTDSTSIVNHFRDRIPSKDLPLFKNLLKAIASLEKNSSGSFWILKPEYREQNSES